MTKAFAVLDTSVLVLLLTKKADDSPDEVQTELRRQAVKQCIRDMQGKWQFCIPTVVVAELTSGSAAKREVQRLVTHHGRFKILALNYSAGCIAADMWRAAQSNKPLTQARGAVKFDTLICATAIAHGANRIVTENPRDFAKHIKSVGASVEVVVPSEPPTKGQLNVFQKRSTKKK